MSIFYEADAISNEKPISDWLMKKEEENLSMRGVRPVLYQPISYLLCRWSFLNEALWWLFL
jgi:hypothetical protein